MRCLSLPQYRKGGLSRSAALHKPRENGHKIICGVTLPAQNFCVRPVKISCETNGSWVLSVRIHSSSGSFLYLPTFKNGFRLAHHGMTEIRDFLSCFV